MQELLELKHKNVEAYLTNIAETMNKEKPNTIGEETLKKGIEMFTSSKYDNYTEEKIYEEINKLIQKMLEERELQRQEFLKKMEEHKKEKFEELKKLYEQTREKYGNLQYEISQVLDVEHMQSFNETKEVQLVGPDGEIVNGFYKGISSPNEYELLVSRLGKIADIPVADYSLYLNNGQVDGISISCIPDKERYDFLSGYDFVKDYPEVSSVVQEIKGNPQKPKPELTKDQTQYYMDMLLKGFAEKVKDPVQLEKLKKDYFETVLFNLILDQKDYNYTNFAVLYDRVSDSYEMAPLFDNGAVKENSSLEGTMITTLGRSKKEDIIDLLYTEYYGYISDFSKRLEQEAEKMQNGEKNIISNMYACISDTLVDSEAVSYQQTVEQTLSIVLQREKSKKDIQDIYYQYPGDDRSKDIKGKVYIISPNTEKGFNCGYSLFVPEGCQLDTTLLVHACNTGGKGVVQGKVRLSKEDKANGLEERTALHLSEGNEAARLSTIEFNPGMWFGSDLKMPVLTPLIPRIDGYYTQAMGSMVYGNDISNLIARNNERALERRLSDAELVQIREQCRDLPEQLTCMIKDSQSFIQQLGIQVDSKVIMEGYSAGSKFANCYTALHPEMVKACISGGTSGLGILPISELNGQKLNFPLGVGNVPNFDAEVFKNIPQFHYIGDIDYNDPAELKGEKQINSDGSVNITPSLDSQGQIQGRYKETYTQHELTQIHSLLGRNPQERFANNQKLYSQLGVNAQFKKFTGDHNSVTQQMSSTGEIVTNEAVKGFIRDVVSKEKKESKESSETKKGFAQRSEAEVQIATRLMNKEDPNRGTSSQKPNIKPISVKKGPEVKSASFTKRSESEVQIASQIKQKNTTIQKQNEQQRSLDKPKVKTLTKPTNNGGGSSAGGFVDTLILTLITGFVAGAIFMLVYSILK